MSKIVGIYAASHTPVMLNFPEQISEAEREQIYGAFRQLGQIMRADRPETLIVIADDHLHNFFLDNMPAFCIGATDHYPMPIEHWLKAERRVFPGDTRLSAHLLSHALEAGFDPAFSMDLTLDHGTVTPLQLAGIGTEVALVPLLVNCVQPPLPTMRRSLQWGRELGEALRCYRGAERVAILATGGLSHDVATPRMGTVNEPFDREFLRRLSVGDDAALIEFADQQVDSAGNGAEEVRTWLMAHAAAGGAAFETLLYSPVPSWYVGISLARWRMEA